MAKRSRDWNEGLAKDLRNPEFAREFVLAMLEDGLSMQVALGKAIRAYGVKEFAKKAKLASSNLLRALDPKHNPTQRTLERLLRQFGLRLTASPLPKRARKTAA